MKKFLLGIFVMLISIQFAQGQVLLSLIFGDKLNSDGLEFGLDGGFNFSNIDGLSDTKALSTFNLGFYFDIKIKNNISLNTGVMVKSTLGAAGLSPYTLGDAPLDSVLQNASVERQLKYFNIPLMLKYKFGDHMFLETGPMISLFRSGKDVFTTTLQDKDDLVFENDITDQYKRFDVGLISGLGYKISSGVGMNIGVRYYIGFLDIVKDNTSGAKFNDSWYLFIAVPIGAGKNKDVGSN